MAFTMLTKKMLFDRLWDRAKAGQPAPSRRLIVKLASLDSEDAAERLLGEMQSDGAISVVKGGAYPWLTLRRSVYAGPLIAGVWLDPEKMERETLTPEQADAPTPKVPVPAAIDRRLPNEIEEYRGASGTARKASSAGESTSATRIIDRAPLPPEPEAIPTSPALSEMPERPEVETVEAQQEGTPTRSPLPASVDQGPRPACPSAQAAEEAAKRDAEPPPPVEARQPKHGYPRGGRVADPETTKRKLAVYLTPEDYAFIDARGESEGLFTGRMASQMLADAVEAARCDTGARHRLSAAVQRAWRADRRPLDTFVTALIEIGLEEYLRFRDVREAA